MHLKLQTMTNKRFSPKLKKSQIILIIFASLLFVSLTWLHFCKPTNCYLDKNWNDGQTLDEISDYKFSRKLFTSPTNNIFFHETSCIKDGIVRLSPRQACAIESAALMNPDHNIYVLFTSQVGFRNRSEMPIIDALLSYPNVHINHLNLAKYAQNTPLEDWIKTGELFRSKYLAFHTSDMLRLLSLYKYGGTYLDLDTVCLKPLNSLRPFSYAASQDHNLVNNAFIHIEGTTGFDIAEIWIMDLKKHFNGQLWTNNGPEVLTRVAYDICGTKDMNEIINENMCPNFRVLPKDVCYAISWQECEKFFKEEYLNEVLSRLMGSLIAHVWSNLSPDILLSKDDNVAYIHLAKNYCPKTFNACDFFLILMTGSTSLLRVGSYF